MPVSADISDLFFNHDVEEAKQKDSSGNFVGYDGAELTRIAGDFCATLGRLGVATPTAEELVEDFLTRV